MSLTNIDSQAFLVLMQEATRAAQNLADRLKDQNLRAVFAESCTGGMASALMVGIPGISDHLCGSAVTYREATKRSWLQVPAETLEQFTAESQQTSEEMAIRILDKTPEADLAAAITGHLSANAEQKGTEQVFVAVAKRSLVRGEDSNEYVAKLVHPLTTDSRRLRQLEAATIMLRMVCEQLKS